MPTFQLGSRENTPIGRIDGRAISAGRIPIQVGCQMLGAVGMSDAPAGATDEECAQAGADRVIDALDMAM